MTRIIGWMFVLAIIIETNKLKSSKIGWLLHIHFWNENIPRTICYLNPLLQYIKALECGHVYITYLLLYLFCSAEHTESPNVSCVARLNMMNGANGEEWWTLVQNSSHFLTGNGSPTDLEMIIHSKRIVPPVFSAIAGYGWVNNTLG